MPNCRIPWLAPATLLALAILLLSCTPAGSNSSGPKIAYVTNGVASFWVIAKTGAEKAGAELPCQVSVHMPSDITDQQRILEDLVTRGVEGIAVSPIDPVNQTEMLNEIGRQTTLITHDSDAPNSHRVCYIGVDNYDAGRMAGKLVTEAMPEGGELVIFVGRMEQDNARRRRQGLIDELLERPHEPDNFDPPGSKIGNDRFTILDTMTDNFDWAKAKANAEDAISKYPDLDAMVGLFTYNIPLCLEALEQAGKVNQVKLISFDEADETLQAILDGKVFGTVVQNPYQYGYQSVTVLHDLLTDAEAKDSQESFVNVPARVIQKHNVEEFWQDLKKKTAEP